jgi:hypothetical protein
MAAPRMIGMTMGDEGARHRHRRVDEKAARLAIESGLEDF